MEWRVHRHRHGVPAGESYKGSAGARCASAAEMVNGELWEKVAVVVSKLFDFCNFGSSSSHHTDESCLDTFWHARKG